MIKAEDTGQLLENYPKPAKRLLETALRLFYRNGFHATGIDTVLAKAGVSKMTLYNHFGSKDGLILAALRLRDTRWRHWFVEFVETHAEEPKDRLLATFDALHDWVNSRDFHGCMFINASAEFLRPKDPVRTAAAEHKRLVLQYITDLADAAGFKDSRHLARQIFLLNEGVIVDAHVSRNRDAATAAKSAALTLLTSARST